MTNWTRTAALALAALALTACSSFDRDWRQTPAATARNEVPRHWDGQWVSAKHRGASGRLRCLLTEVDKDHCRARFRAKWLLFTSDYSVVLDTRPRRNGLELRGSQRLTGIGGGIYRYEGFVTPARFSASYHSSYDYGRFEMTPARP